MTTHISRIVRSLLDRPLSTLTHARGDCVFLTEQVFLVNQNHYESVHTSLHGTISLFGVQHPQHNEYLETRESKVLSLATGQMYNHHIYLFDDPKSFVLNRLSTPRIMFHRRI